MVSIAEQFTPTPENCNQILNASTIILVTGQPCGQDEPIVHTLSVDTALVGGEESIDLTSDQLPDGTFLRKNSVIHFASGEERVVTADTIVTTGTSVPIEADPNPIADTDTATTWAMLMVLSPTNVPLNIEASEVNRTDLTFGMQGSMVKSKIEINNQVSTIGRKDDRALYDLIFGSSYTDQRLYTLFAYSDDTHSFGQAEIITWNRDGNIEEITRPQFTVKLQAPFGVAKPYQWETTANQTLLNNLRRFAGLCLLS